MMQNITIMALMAVFLISCHNSDGSIPKKNIEEPWTGKIDGVFLKGEYIDIGKLDRLYIRYGPISDSGVELERVINGEVIWRVHAEPLGIGHSQYLQKIYTRIDGDEIYLESKASGGNFSERRSLDIGVLIERTVKR